MLSVGGIGILFAKPVHPGSRHRPTTRNQLAVRIAHLQTHHCIASVQLGWHLHASEPMRLVRAMTGTISFCDAQVNASTPSIRELL